MQLSHFVGLVLLVVGCSVESAPSEAVSPVERWTLELSTEFDFDTHGWALNAVDEIAFAGGEYHAEIDDYLTVVQADQPSGECNTLHLRWGPASQTVDMDIGEWRCTTILNLRPGLSGEQIEELLYGELAGVLVVPFELNAY